MSTANANAARPWWQPLGVSSPSQAWVVISGLVAIIGLLSAFLQVLQSNQRQAASRHAAEAARAEATWRCSFPRGKHLCDAGMLQARDTPVVAVSMFSQ